MRSSFVQASISLVILFSGTASAKAWDSGLRTPLLEPLPPPVVVAGSRVGFTRDTRTGRINVHFTEQFHPEHVEILKRQRSLGTVFFSRMRRKPLSDGEMKLLADVPLTGLVLMDVPISNLGLEALRAHKTIESISLDRTRVTDGGLDHLGTLPQLKRVSFSSAEVTDTGLGKISQWQQLRTVWFSQCSKITPEGVAQLAHLEKLEILLLNNNPKLTSALIKPISRLANLRRLELDGIQLTAADCAELAALQKLDTLGLSGTGLTDNGLRELSRFPLLSSLTIQEAAISDEGIAALRDCPRLHTLDISQTSIGDRGLAHLAELLSLQSLELSATKVTDEGLKSVAKLGKLKVLSLSDTSVTDAGLKHLDDLQHLETLYLNNTKVSDAQIERVYDLHPGMQIFPMTASVMAKRDLLHKKP